MIHRAKIDAEMAGMRLDDGMKLLFPSYSKGRIRKVIDWGGCRVGDAVVRIASRSLRVGDEIVFAVTDPDPLVGYELSRADILFEDSTYLVLSKPAGVYCQRTPYQLKGTVEYAVERYFRSVGIQEPARVVHRLDRETSGVMVFPKDRPGAAWFSEELRKGNVEKVYRAVVAGDPSEDRWMTNAPIAPSGKSRFQVADDGRAALTEFRVLAREGERSLVEARPKTGRTHQIRLHLVHAGHPVVGDDRYGGPPGSRMMLHCLSMSFRGADGRWISVESPGDAAFRSGPFSSLS